VVASGNGLTNREKVEMVIRYVATSQRDFWKSMEGYQTADWNELCRELRKTYVDTSTHGRFSRQKLFEFVNHSTKSRMKEEDDVVQYYRQFSFLSKPLLDSSRMISGERDTMFWYGFHPEDRTAMWARLIAKHPEQPEGKAFYYEDVLKVARAVFSGDHWSLFQVPDQQDPYANTRRRGADRSLERWFGPEDRDPRGPDRDQRAPEREREPPIPEYLPRETARYQEAEEPVFPEFRARESLGRREVDAPRAFTPQVETKTVRFKDPLRADEGREIEDLVNQMHSMSVRDRAYAALYA
jgi:hypothetical protein